MTDFFHDLIVETFSFQNCPEVVSPPSSSASLLSCFASLVSSFVSLLFSLGPATLVDFNSFPSTPILYWPLSALFVSVSIVLPLIGAISAHRSTGKKKSCCTCGPVCCRR